MQLTTVKELFKERDKYLNQEIQVGGWIRSIRDSKAFGFIVLNDGTSFDTLQIVYHDTMANFAEVSKLNVCAGSTLNGNFCCLDLKRLLCLRCCHESTFNDDGSADI